MIAAKDNPCHFCTKRYLGCHDKCEDYISWKKKHIETLKAISKENKVDSAYRDFRIQNRDKYRKSHRHLK